MNEVETQADKWDLVIRPTSGLFEINFKALWSYRDLLLLLVRRDFVATYKQTILGPIWFFLQPILTTLIFVIIFGRVAGLSPEGVPMIVFYMAGITLWNYFSESLNKTATVFKDNASIFGKVYFPRLIMPLSIVVSNLVKLGIQLFLFLLFWSYFLFIKHEIHPNLYILLTPVLILLLGFLGLGFGMIISAMTTKYRDLALLLAFGVQLMMYATPIIYPLAKVSPKYRWLLEANPMTSIVETFRYAFLGKGSFNWFALAYSSGMTLVLVLLGTIIFNKIEKSFMDTV
jgi:lipopolysaccharide transport system permease protein